MKQFLYFLLLICTFSQMKAQVVVYKKTAQRSDNYLNNAWTGKDSFLFSYNNDTLMTSLQALQFNVNNTWDNWYKYTYTLTANGKVSTQLRENWVAGNWTNNTRYTYSYDANSNITDILYDVWSGASWSPTGKISYTGYNAYGKYQSEILYVYGGGAYTQQSKRDRTYVNNQTLVATDEKYTWNNQNNVWVKNERLSYTYTQNEISSVTRLLPDANANWAPEDKFLYNFNITPFYLLEYIAQKYDTATMSWKNLNRVTYAYNADTLLDKTQNETFLNNTWSPVERAQYIYNGSKEKIEYFTESYNGGWDKLKRSLYTYNNSLLAEEDQFTGSGNTWLASKKLLYNYDANNNLIYETAEDYTGANFTPVTRSFYYYNSFTVGMANRLKSFAGLTIYPNPATEFVNIRLNAAQSTTIQVNILDLYGKTHVVMTQPVSTPQALLQIPCATLQNGLYFAQIKDLQDNKQQTVKFQIVK